MEESKHFMIVMMERALGESPKKKEKPDTGAESGLSASTLTTGT